jgi:hypothetical protein
MIATTALTAGGAEALTINATFGSACGFCDQIGLTYGSLAGNAPAEGAIEAAVHQVASQFGATNLTVNILFFDAPSQYEVAFNYNSQVAYPYGTYVAALTADAVAHPWNKTLATAVANLPYGNGAAVDPAPTFVAVSTPAARALGLGVVPSDFGPQDAAPEFDALGDFVGGGVGAGGTVDGIVFLNSEAPFSYTRPVPPPSPDPSANNPYDAQTAMEHEIDEVLGIGGGGSMLNYANGDPNYAKDYFGVDGALYGQMDLYRYSGVRTPSFKSYDEDYDYEYTLAGGGVYFSVDGGKTRIDLFNNGLEGDSGDWALTDTLCPGGGGQYVGGFGNVQDAFACNNVAYDVQPGSPEYAAFEAIGYNPVPEPAQWTLLLAGSAMTGFVLRTSRARLRGRRRRLAAIG